MLLKIIVYYISLCVFFLGVLYNQFLSSADFETLKRYAEVIMLLDFLFLLLPSLLPIHHHYDNHRHHRQHNHYHQCYHQQNNRLTKLSSASASPLLLSMLHHPLHQSYSSQ